MSKLREEVGDAAERVDSVVLQLHADAATEVRVPVLRSGGGELDATAVCEVLIGCGE